MRAVLVQDAQSTVLTSDRRTRHPGQNGMERALAEQRLAPRQSPLARLLGASPLAPGAAPWFAGAQGERHVGEILARLPDGWTSYHSLPTGLRDNDIDHVVVGPGGVFTIDAKRHRGRSVWIAGSWVLVGGRQRPDYLPAAEYEANRMERMLAARVDVLPAVTPVLAFVEPRRMTVRRRPETVVALSAKHLARWLVGRPPVWSDEQRESAVRAIDDLAAETTQDPASGSDARAGTGLDVPGSFRALESAVRRARARRLAWGVAAGTGVLTSSAALLPLLSLLS
jgi:hypothetical protein